MLSELQLRVAGLISELPEADGFALAGGGALIARGEIARQTRDLDFFGPSVHAVEVLVPVVERALTLDGLKVDRVLEGRGFTRLLIESADERTEVDLGNDARLFPVEHRGKIPVLSGEELAVDKVLAVFGRAEPRDFADLASVVDRYGLAQLFDLAFEKDRGFDPRAFSQMVNRFSRLPREEFPLDDRQYDDLAAIVSSWQERALDLAQERDRSKDRGPDTGLGL